MIRECLLFIDQHAQPDLAKAMKFPLGTQLMIHLNALYLNMLGALDNLAWMLAFELGLHKDLGERGSKPGVRAFCNLFGDKFLAALEPLRPELAHLLVKHRTWYLEVRQLRDPAAHRIPLKFSRAVLTEADRKLVDELQAKAGVALKRLISKPEPTGDQAIHLIREAGRLTEESASVGAFLPIIVTSDDLGYESRSGPDQIRKDHTNYMNVAEMVFNSLNVDWS
jgi:hypothetical protein